MLTKRQMDNILATPGSYTYWCVTSPTGDPFWSHSRIGRVLHTVTPTERAAQRERMLW